MRRAPKASKYFSGAKIESEIFLVSSRGDRYTQFRIWPLFVEACYVLHPAACSDQYDQQFSLSR